MNEGRTDCIISKNVEANFTCLLLTVCKILPEEYFVFIPREDTK